MSRLVLTTMITVFSMAAFAEHDAVYCGTLLDGSAGIDAFFGEHPEAILAVQYRVRDGVDEPWEEGFASLNAIPERERLFVQRAVKASQARGTLFCVKARWGGAAYRSKDLQAITLSTDSIDRIDYMSAFVR